jgi:membrane associated rhomboid family serine protease/Zn-finger nucleic acid-binding protein
VTGGCPNCRVPLEESHVQATVFAACPNCGGSFIPIAAVHHAIRQDIQQQLLAQVRATRKQGTQNCPRCALPVTLVEVPRGPKPVELEVCYHCDCVWFDARKYDALKVLYGIQEPPKHMLDHKWKWAVALLGMPVERQSVAMLNRPWLTWILASFITLVSVTAWFVPVLQLQFALAPAMPWRLGGITLLTCFFLHGGLFHLASNMYFLIVFGEKVEDYLGRMHYLLLLLSATLAGNLLEIAAAPHSNQLLVGASGGISGLIVFYGLQFPRVRLLILTRLLIFFPLRLQAWAALMVWILLQLIGAGAELKGFSNVASLAHLGGAAMGLFFWLRWRDRLNIAL